METKKNNKFIYLIIIFLIMQNAFFFINTKEINVSGKFAYADIWLILYVICFGLLFIKYCIKSKTKYSFGGIILLLSSLVLISAIQQNFITGQSLSLGIRPQRYYLMILLSYFPIKQLFLRNKIDENVLIDFLFKLGLFSAILFIFQKIVIDNLQFLHFQIRIRNGSARFYIDSTLIQIATIISIYYFYTKRKNKYLIATGIFLFYQFWVTQGRLEIVSIIIAILVGILLTGKLTNRKVIILSIAAIMVVFFLSTTYVQNLILAIQNSNTASSAQGNTMEIRNIGRKMYMEQLTKSPLTFIFGCGYPNELYAIAAAKAGINDEIYLNDNGIYGYMYIYGTLGVIIVAVLMFKLLKKAIHIFKDNGNTIPLMYLILNICLCYNIIFWYWKADGTFILVIMLCYIEELERRIKIKEEEKD